MADERDSWEILRAYAAGASDTGCREPVGPQEVADVSPALDERMPIPLGKWLNDDGAVPMSSAKTHLSRLAAYANDTGESITVIRDGVPWIELRPLAHRSP